MPLLLLGCVARSPLLDVEPTPALERADVEWFDLEGADRIALLESCIERCPRDDDGTPVASRTSWNLHWDWMRAPVEPCEVAAATVVASVTVELPRWTPPAEADPALVTEWGTWHARLRGHEQGHVDVVHVFAHDAEARLEAAGCDGIVEEGERLVANLRAAQRDYDLATAHGHMQGAAFWDGP
jgi:predicted secreted Zn-dependent protease